MVNWTSLISNNRKAVVQFATGNLSVTDFQKEFTGTPNEARYVVRSHGAQYARRLARKALRHRGIL